MRSADVLVLGAAGLVGSHVRRAFAGRRVVATYHRTPAEDAIPLDVTDAAAVRDLIASVRPDVVILAAAEAHVERCEREPEVTRRVNVDATRAVVDRARTSGACIVFFSSEYVFRGDAGPYGEEAPLDPINEYGRQKAEAEAIVRSAERHIVCRTSGVFGWEPLRKNFVCQLVRALREGEDFAVPDDQAITPTYAPDLAQAVAELVAGGHVGAFHVVGPRVVARVEFARLVARAFRLPDDRIRPRPTPGLTLAAARPTNAGLRDDKLRSVLGRGLSEPSVALRDMARTEPGTPAAARAIG